MPGYKVIKENGKEFFAKDLQTLRRWLKEKRVKPNEQVYHQASERWISVKEMLGLTIEGIHYADLGKRFTAHLIDVLLIYFGVMILLLLSTIISDVIPGSVDDGILTFLSIIGFPWFYYSAMESSPRQATLGKMALKVMVTDLYGNRISFGRATARFFSKMFISTILCIGFLLAFFTRKKQALHDLIAGTLVVNKK